MNLNFVHKVITAVPKAKNSN